MIPDDVLTVVRELKSRADIADPVNICIALIGIRRCRTIVAAITDTIAIGIDLTGIGFGAAVIADITHSIVVYI